ncbi:hypothetical protein CXG81DRAFT_13795 [Caulochytrium protostelioides]|uniref:Glutaredoxin domain-containing protein n=1 Tax=Caulochytrium protostelioides TaxID=1555241 RepID=A0A4P9X4L2_9FUNG|nr:hypothetical protein CXG81DRAFT_13795 [Caulochytrium protostelioides]|eukprot:RKO99980.1 hypothetical protein CXG81DRAFT_13795 [Caulochytrium protostelioides]
MSSPAKIVADLIKSSAIAMVGGTYCPYCLAMQSTLQSHHYQFAVLWTDKVDNGDAIKAYITETTGQRTVPHLWVHGKYVPGGNSEFQKLVKNGTFDKMVKAGPQA